MKQGSYGIAVRNPVYLKDKNEQEYFWGFTIVILRVPDIFSDSIHALSDFGYEYRILKTEAPWSFCTYIHHEDVPAGLYPLTIISRIKSSPFCIPITPYACIHFSDDTYKVVYQSDGQIDHPVSYAFTIGDAELEI